MKLLCELKANATTILKNSKDWNGHHFKMYKISVESIWDNIVNWNDPNTIGWITIHRYIMTISIVPYRILKIFYAFQWVNNNSVKTMWRYYFLFWTVRLFYAYFWIRSSKDNTFWNTVCMCQRVHLKALLFVILHCQ